MQPYPSSASPAASSDPAPAARAAPSCRLPDELVLMVAEQCVQWWKRKTLASLCRLAKRFKAPAERLLYSHVFLELRAPNAQPEARSVLYALVHFPRYRPLVKCVYLAIECRTIADLAPEVVSALCSLSSKSRQSQYLRDYPSAFATVKRLYSEKSSTLLFASALPALKNLEIVLEVESARAAWVEAKATLGSQLTSLTLYVSPTEVNLFRNLSAFVRLDHLCLDIEHDRDQALAPTIKAIVKSLRSLSRSPGITSLYIRVDGPRALGLPAEANDILYAFPPQLRTLGLSTSAIRSEEFATCLLSALRPPAMRVLYLADALGDGLADILDDPDGPHGALAGELERAGIEVTTQARSDYW